MLKKFDFNDKALLSAVLFVQHTSTADRATGKLSVQIPAFVPVATLSAVLGTTHFKLVTGAAEFDFDKNEYIKTESKTELIPYNEEEVPAFNLEVSLTANTKQAFVHALAVEFYQAMSKLNRLITVITCADG